MPKEVLIIGQTEICLDYGDGLFGDPLPRGEAFGNVRLKASVDLNSGDRFDVDINIHVILAEAIRRLEGMNRSKASFLAGGIVIESQF